MDPAWRFTPMSLLLLVALASVALAADAPSTRPGITGTSQGRMVNPLPARSSI